MAGSRFDQLRISTTLANSGLESYTDGSIGESAIRVGAGFGLALDANGVSVDGTAATFKTPCRVRSTANVSIASAPATIDGVTLASGDRILLDNQTTTTQDGIYVFTAAAAALTRSADAPTGAEAAGWYIQVLEGTQENLYRIDAGLGGATIGTDDWTTSVFSGGASRTAGAGLVDGSGDDLDVNPGNGIQILTDRVVARLALAVGAQQYGGIVASRNADGSAAGTANQGYMAVQTDNTGLEVNSSNQVALKANGVTATQINTSAVGNGLAGGGGTALSVDPDTGISVSASGVAFDATAVDGNGLTGTGSTLSVDVDSETGGNIQGVNVTANGVGLDVAAIAGTGIEADGSANLRVAAQGNGIAGGGGTTLSVDADTGISVSGSGVAVDTGSTVTFVSPAVWTFPNGTTAEGLFVTGTPTDANHAVNKTYVDNAVTGVNWRQPASVLEYAGTRTIAQIDALSPTSGLALVAGSAGTPAAGTSDLLAIGDIAEFDGTSWKVIVANSAGTPPSGTRAVVAYPVGDTLYAPLTDGTDEGKIAQWPGGNLTPALTTPGDGDAILINGENSVNENSAFVYDGSVPSGEWVQFSGAGQINAGIGLTKSSNTINVGVTAVTNANATIIGNTDSIEVKFAAAGSGTGGLAAAAGGLSVDPGDGIVLTAGGVAVALEAAGVGTGGLAFDSAEVRINVDGTTSPGTTASVLSLNANGLAVNVDNSTVEASAAGGSLRVKDLGITTAKLAASAVTEAKIGFSFREETFAASAFALSSGNYVVSLANTAIATAKTYGFNECYRNGVADLTNTLAVDPATATEYRVTTSELQFGANITASGDVYRVRYLSTALT